MALAALISVAVVAVAVCGVAATRGKTTSSSSLPAATTDDVITSSANKQQLPQQQQPPLVRFAPTKLEEEEENHHAAAASSIASSVVSNIEVGEDEDMPSNVAEAAAAGAGGEQKDAMPMRRVTELRKSKPVHHHHVRGDDAPAIPPRAPQDGTDETIKYSIASGRPEGSSAPLFAASLGATTSACYIVKLRRGVGLQGVRRIREELLADYPDASHIGDFSATIEGFSVRDVSADLLATIRAHPLVEFVEEDSEIVPISVPSWGLDRIDQLDLPLNNVYSVAGNKGAGVDAYVIDSRILSAHSEFKGRVGGGMSFITGDSSWEDCYGHGTHVSGTVGGATVGVAPGVTLFALRVFTCSGAGTMTSVIAALDWLVTNMRSGRRSVANLSLAGGASTAFDSAVRAAISAGAVVVVAAGNDNLDACSYSPARVAEAITVGATDNTDTMADFSNFGTCVDVLAPGKGIVSAYIGSTTKTASMSGTSMASPHICGAAALYLGSNPKATPAQVQTAIIAAAVASTISGIKSGTVNRFLYVNPLVATAAAAPATTAPRTTARPATTTAASSSSSSCKGNKCQTGTVAAKSSVYYPTPSGYYCTTSATASKTHHAILKGVASSSVDLDLYLLLWDASVQKWVTQASSTNAGNNEEVWFTSTTAAGCWSWMIYSYYGSSTTFTLDMTIPA